MFSRAVDHELEIGVSFIATDGKRAVPERYQGLLANEMRRRKQSEDENGRLRKVVTDLGLDKAMLQDALRGKL